MACGCFVTAVGAADRSESLMNEILGRDDKLYKKRYFSSYSNFKGTKVTTVGAILKLLYPLKLCHCLIFGFFRN